MRRPSVYTRVLAVSCTGIFALVMINVFIGPHMKMKLIPLKADDIIRYAKPCAGLPEKQTKTNNKEGETLQEALDALDWNQVYSQANARWPSNLMETYQNALVPHLEQQYAAIKTHERPVPLASSLNCSNVEYIAFLTGEKRSSVPKVLDFFMFNCELDILETRLYELNDTVDMFVILESTHSHRGVHKPLFFARNQERFKLFMPKIIHLVADFSDNYHHIRTDNNIQVDGDFWDIEKEGRSHLWEGFIKAVGPGFVDQQDLLIGGDLDEIPSGEIVYHLKHCQLREGALPLGIKSYFYRFNFRWIYGEHDLPKIFTRNFLGGRDDFCRACPIALVSPHAGAHLTYFGPVAFSMWKQLTIAEGGAMPDTRIARNVALMEDLIDRGKRVCCPDDQLRVVKQEDLANMWIPWFPNENRERFPHFFPNITK